MEPELALLVIFATVTLSANAKGISYNYAAGSRICYNPFPHVVACPGLSKLATIIICSSIAGIILLLIAAYYIWKCVKNRRLKAASTSVFKPNSSAYTPIPNPSNTWDRESLISEPKPSHSNNAHVLGTSNV